MTLCVGYVPQKKKTKTQHVDQSKIDPYGSTHSSITDCHERTRCSSCRPHPNAGYRSKVLQQINCLEKKNLTLQFSSLRDGLHFLAKIPLKLCGTAKLLSLMLRNDTTPHPTLTHKHTPHRPLQVFTLRPLVLFWLFCS